MTDSYPIVDLDSDFENTASSEDDLDVILHGTPEQKRRLRRRSLGQKSSSDDDFEKEMSAELDATIKSIESNQRTATTCVGSSGGARQMDGEQSTSQGQFYNTEYFDSDSDDEQSSKQKQSRKHPVVSNDDLLYDPHMDEEDQQWVNRQRSRYQPPTKMAKNTPRPLPRSDAVLNCPACMALLCRDCQRHSTYKTQFRAMFVQNCQVDTSEALHIPAGKPKNRKSKKQTNRESNATQEDQETSTENTSTSTGIPVGDCTTATDRNDMYHPVRCSECTTQVGVYDNDEVYHFFNILASY